MKIEDSEKVNGIGPCSDKELIGSGPNVLRSPIAYEPPEEGANLSTEFLKCFRKYSNRTLIIDGPSGLKWTGAQLFDATTRIASNLSRQLNLGPNKNIALICEHSDREVIFAISCWIAGCSIYPQNPDDGLEEIKTICTMIPVDAIATQCKHHQLVAELRKSLPNQDIPIIWVDDQMEPARSFENANNDNNNDTNSNDNNNNDDANYKQEMIERDGVILLDDILHHGERDLEFVEKIGNEMIKSRKCPGYYMLTSGSTGYPKVVEVMQWAVISSAKSMYVCCETVWTDGVANERLLPLTSDSVLAGDLPMDHGAGISFLIMTMMLGAKYVVLPIDNLDNLCNSIGQYKIDFLINGSTKIFQLLKKLKEQYPINKNNQLFDVTSLKFISSVGAKVNFEPLIRDVERLYPNMQVTQSYGLTEVSYVATLPLSEARDNIQPVGWLFPGITGIVVDSDGNQLGPNEEGELHLWADSLFSRYICRQGIDAKQVLADCHDDLGYYKTGDLVHYDERGRLFIHGRIKETLTLRHEWKILPAELEEIVNQHPLIEFTVIVGAPDPEVPGVEVPKAYVKLVGRKSEKYGKLEANASKNIDEYANKLVGYFDKKEYDAIEKDIYEFAAARTAEVKHLNGGVTILEEFPKNGRLQKINRKVLKQMACSPQNTNSRE